MSSWKIGRRLDCWWYVSRTCKFTTTIECYRGINLWILSRRMQINGLIFLSPNSPFHNLFFFLFPNAKGKRRRRRKKISRLDRWKRSPHIILYWIAIVPLFVSRDKSNDGYTEIGYAAWMGRRMESVFHAFETPWHYWNLHRLSIYRCRWWR